MKKSLIALAVLASTGAMAQSSVTLYGIVDVNLQSQKIGVNTGTAAVPVYSINRQTRVESGGVNGSRFGLKGAEDLGGGLKALFVLEGGFSVDTGASGKTGSLFNRQSYVGLGGGFGEVRIGNVRTAYDDTSVNSDALWDSLLSPLYMTVGGANTSIWTNNYNPTPGNSLYYTTPSFGGLTAAVSYSLGENKTATSNAKGVGAVNVQYSGGPIYASLAYQEDKTLVTALTTGDSRKSTLLNASYDFGVVKLEGSFNRNVTKADVTANQYQIGVDVPVGSALTLSTGIAYSKDKDSVNSNEDKRAGVGIGAKYSLSKRTFVYTGATFGQIKDGSTGVKTKNELYAVGINHSF